MSVLSGSYWTNLGASLINTLRTFPRESLISLAMMICFLIVAHEPSNDYEKVVMRTAMGLILSLSISLTFTVLRRAGRIGAILDWVLSTALISLTLWYMQAFDFDSSASTTEFAYLAVLVHLAVACVWMVYSGAGSFWNATTALFYRALYASIFSNLLQGGLILAIASIRVLFNWNQFDKLEIDIMICVNTFFMTLFFLSEFPSQERVERQPIVPKLTVSFVQYVLTPVIAVFTVILYAYGVKLLTSQMSSELVSYVVLLTGVSVLASLLTWPLRNESRPLLALLHKWIYPLLLPLLLLGAWSLVMRYTTDGIDRWGFTLGVLESIGLLTVVISIVKRTSDPRIPALVSLGVFAVTSIGPLGVNAVVARYEANHPKDQQIAAVKDNTSALAQELDTQPNVVSYRSNGQWLISFKSTPNDTLRTKDALITSRYDGTITVICSGNPDTLLFDLRPMLAKLNPRTDSVYPSISSITSRKQRATLLCTNVQTIPPDSTNPRRTILSVSGMIVVNDE